MVQNYYGPKLPTNATAKRAPATAYVPVAARVGLGFRSAYAVPTPRPNMLAVIWCETWLRFFAALVDGYERVGVHGRGGGVVVGAYVRRRAARLSYTVPVEATDAMVARYDRFGSEAV